MQNSNKPTFEHVEQDDNTKPYVGSMPVAFEVPNAEVMKRFQRLVPVMVEESWGCQHWFFLYWNTGETVAYARVREYENYIELFDIEVQECYRGLGYARETLSVLAWETKKPIRHIENDYTPLGLERVSHFFNTGTPQHKDYPRVQYGALSFVSWWELMLPKLNNMSTWK